jgi:hypothetical protein
MPGDDILFQRMMAYGPSVHIRRTSAAGVTPVKAVLEVERRAGTPRAGMGTPPALLRIEAESEAAAVAALEPKARDDRAIVQMLRDKGLR